MDRAEVFKLIERNCAYVEESSENGIVAHELNIDDFIEDLFSLLNIIN